jgi:branched-chain amino acid transport system ATP-binding protein
MALIELKNISRYFGGLAAVLDLSMEAHQGEILGLIGPNGAGKTTTFSVITGDYPPSEGKILFEGKNIAGLQPHKIAKLGIVRSFQLNTLFPHLSVQENVLLGLHLRSTIGFWEGLVNTSSNRKKEDKLNKEAEAAWLPASFRNCHRPGRPTENPAFRRALDRDEPQRS